MIFQHEIDKRTEEAPLECVNYEFLGVNFRTISRDYLVKNQLTIKGIGGVCQESLETFLVEEFQLKICSNFGPQLYEVADFAQTPIVWTNVGAELNDKESS